MNLEELSNVLSKYLPQNAVSTIAYWIYDKRIHLKIVHQRTTKLGDYTPPYHKKWHTISVNGDLNPYAFLITITHELAHLHIWEQYKERVTAHGQEWKKEFRHLMNFFMGKNIFPVEVEKALFSYYQNMRSSTCYDVSLMRALRKYDTHKETLPVEQLEENAVFQVENGRIFKKIKKIRKRYHCVELATQKIFLFSPVAEVKKITTATSITSR